MSTKHSKAFSLIELIFVILITAILAAVAIQKLANVANEAEFSKIKGFTGTLNRTVGPSLWMESLPSNNGSITHTSILEGREVDTIPSAFDISTEIMLGSCMESNTTVPNIDDPVGGLTAGAIAETKDIGGNIYVLGCINSNGSTSAKFYLYDKEEEVIVY